MIRASADIIPHTAECLPPEQSAARAKTGISNCLKHSARRHSGSAEVDIPATFSSGLHSRQIAPKLLRQIMVLTGSW
jgi:hypothetical protein